MSSIGQIPYTELDLVALNEMLLFCLATNLVLLCKEDFLKDFIAMNMVG